MTEDSERIQILEMIERGVISAAEGVRLLNAIRGELPEIAPGRAAEIPQPEPEPVPEPRVEPAPFEEPAPQTATARAAVEASARKWRRWWWVPLWVGVGITVISAGLMYWAYAANDGFGFWFACTWFPFLLGVAIMALAWASRTARWLHVRVHQAEGEKPRNIAISLPLPIRFTAWLVRIFRPHIPQAEGVNIDEMILALEKTSPDSPMFVQVDEGKDGERVEVYIG